MPLRNGFGAVTAEDTLEWLVGNARYQRAHSYRGSR